MEDIVIIAGDFDRLVPRDIDRPEDATLFNDLVYRIQNDLEQGPGVVPAVAISGCAGPNPFQGERLDLDLIPKDEWDRYCCAEEMANICTERYSSESEGNVRGIVISIAALSLHNNLNPETIDLITKCLSGGGFVATLTETEKLVRRTCKEMLINPKELLVGGSVGELVDRIDARLHHFESNG